jgi:hypothetical protein
MVKMAERTFMGKLKIAESNGNIRLEGDRGEGTYPPFIEIEKDLVIKGGEKTLLKYSIPKGKKLQCRVVIKGKIVNVD